MMGEGGDTVDTPSHSSPSNAVLTAVAECEGVAVEEVCPPEYQSLHDVVDPQALDELFAPRADGTPRQMGNVSFRFCGYDVTLESDGSITLE